MRPHQHDIKILRINTTLVACRPMLCQIIQREFRAAPCYCCTVIMTVLRGTDYNLRGWRLTQRFWWRLTLPECYTVCTGGALPHVSEERTAFIFRASHTRRDPCRTCPCYLLLRLNELTFFYFSPPPPHLFALIFRSSSLTNRFLFRIFYFLPGSRIPPDMWHRIFVMLFFVVVSWSRQLVAGLLSICPRLIPNSSVWDLRYTKWYWERFLSEYSGILASRSTKAPYTFTSLLPTPCSLYTWLKLN